MNKKKVLAKLNPLFLKGIAHRGFHNEEFTENGMKAFDNAIKCIGEGDPDSIWYSVLN